MHKKDKGISSEAILSLKDVSKEFTRGGRRTQALEKISLDIYKGDFLVVLGPSGCGKSTLLNLLAGFIKATEGSCLMHKEKITGPGPDRGVVFQSASLYPWFTVEKNRNFALRMKKEPPEDIKRKTSEMLKEIMLEDYKNHHSYELSGGMKQRVALGRALINDPEILLMDEPFGALDSFTRFSMQKLLLNLWAEKERTFFLITHDIEEALLLVSKIIVMTKSPGQICRVYETGFNKKMIKDPSYHFSLDQDFANIKAQIIDLIKIG